MKWYIAKLIYQIKCGNGNHTPQFEEQLRLVEAVSEEHAFQKAISLGAGGQDIFYNYTQQLVRWEFVNVLEMYRLNILLDGTELYSRINEIEDADTYIKYVNRKAKSIQETLMYQLPNSF